MVKRGLGRLPFEYSGQVLNLNNKHYGVKADNDKFTEHGIGRKCQIEGGIYEGQFVNGIPNGFGRQIYPSGTYYLGYFKNGQRHGLGKLSYDTG